jgi:hypothetical protein
MAVRVVPWIRSGLALEVTKQATRGQTTTVRATATVQVTATANDGDVTAAATERSIELFGPGDIAAIDEHQVRLRYPTPNAPDAEWNYFAFVEFHDADLPWRYSPAGPGTDGIAPPWLALVVVEEGVEAEFDSSARLPVLRVGSAEHLPPPADLWAWAHAFGEGDPVADVGAFSARVMCPRRLRPHRHWRACLVPAFRTGRNAGLGLPPGDDPGPAWQPDDSDVDLPVYATWTFHTGELDGTFLSLAQKLEPRELSPGVGVRELDLSTPGMPMPDAPGARADFVGAMYSPQYDPSGRVTADLDAFASIYRAEVSRGDDPPSEPGASYDAAVDDPVVRLPRYGSPQRRGEVLPADDDHWYATVNTDPGQRAVAALGASVVRNDQEDLLAAAWEHAASLTQINQSLQRARLAEEMAKQRTAKFRALDAGHQFQLSGPAVGRIQAGSLDLADALAAAAISPVVAGGAFRRMTRPGGAFQRATTAQPATATVPAPAEHFAAATLASGAAAFATPAPKLLPAGLDIGMRVDAPVVSTGVVDLDSFVTLGPGTLAPMGGGIGSIDVTWSAPTSTLTIGSTLASLGGSTAAGAAQPVTATLAPAAQPTTVVRRPAAVRRSASAAAATASAGASISGIGPVTRLGGLLGPLTNEPFPTGWAVDNNIPFDEVLPEIRERILDEITHLVATRPADAVRRGTPAEPLPSFDTDVGDLLTSQIDPALGVRAWVDAHIARIETDGARTGVLDNGTPIPTALTARPKFHVPMYERLRALSVEYVVPGVGSIPPNTVGALSVNNAFVESFLIGANHELSREFRWREYPAPLHLTWFDQFWDVGPGGPADIAPIGSWKPTELGSHARGGDRLVVLVHGELIDRFPNLSVYMVEAEQSGGERVMADTEPQLPVFSGRLQHGLHFYGFELPAADKGQVDEAQFGGTHDQGWFFGLEEPPRSPRFGLNVGEADDLGEVPAAAFELSWRHVKRDADHAPAFVDEARTPSNLEGHRFDTGVWFHDAATMAATTFRRPTRVLIHATALLGDH